MAKNECDFCGGKFGLALQRHHGKRFCRMKCLDDYKLGKPPDQYELSLDKPPDSVTAT